MNNEQPKKLNEITPEDIKDAALVYAEQFNLHAERGNCTIQAIPPGPLPVEMGEATPTRLPITQWLVTIDTKDIIGLVPVEYISGAVSARDFTAVKKGRGRYRRIR